MGPFSLTSEMSHGGWRQDADRGWNEVTHPQAGPIPPLALAPCWAVWSIPQMITGEAIEPIQDQVAQAGIV